MKSLELSRIVGELLYEAYEFPYISLDIELPKLHLKDNVIGFRFINIDKESVPYNISDANFFSGYVLQVCDESGNVCYDNVDNEAILESVDNASDSAVDEFNKNINNIRKKIRSRRRYFLNKERKEISRDDRYANFLSLLLLTKEENRQSVERVIFDVYYKSYDTIRKSSNTFDFGNKSVLIKDGRIMLIRKTHYGMVYERDGTWPPATLALFLGNCKNMLDVVYGFVFSKED